MRVLNIINNLGEGGVERVLIDTIRNTYKKVEHTIMIKTDQNYFSKELNSLGVPVIQAPSYSMRNFFDHYGFLKKFFEENSNNFDLIHLYCGSLNYYTPIYLSNKFKIPIIIHSHNSSSRSNLLNVSHRIIRIYHQLFGTSYNIACSKAAGEWLFGKNNFEVLLNGIDVNKYQESFLFGRNLRNQLLANTQSIVIGHVGGFTKTKNQRYLIEFLEKINVVSDKSIELVLIGDGPLKDEMQNLVKNKHLVNKVHFLGFQNKIENFLGLFDIYMMPSLYEGLPLVLLENQAVGTPILASDTIDLSSKVNRNYLVFNLNDNFHQVYNFFLKLIKIGRVRTDLLGSDYDIKVFSKKILSLYEYIIENEEDEING
ncbi:glycosyltransferase [Facklamia hominis]|uniref:glycosyltransferase n=1 Tax=Facklamia hominis TaxID=178214 RepID=UPI000C7D49E1|nr:glycosyltransferase [Facklamia hominis]PKY93790.1 hypothetical protein CYJ56_00855 [Facklamia hominis]